nr:hypothetical protein [Campylobacter jejuni]
MKCIEALVGLLCIFGYNNYELLELAIKGGANVDMQTLLDPKSEYNETLLFEAVRTKPIGLHSF